MEAAENANQPPLTHSIVKNGANSSSEKISEDTNVKA